MKFLLSFVLTSFSFLAFAQEPYPYIIGHTREMGSVILDESRLLNIYLPPAYNDMPDTVHFPVIYLLDGSADEDFLHVCGLLQYYNFPWINLEPQAIIVGIANVDRRRDFTYPTTIAKDKEANPTSGESGNFMAFLESELIPFIDEHYRTTQQRTIIGQSLGGLVATEILYTKPQLFDRYIIQSPSLWWDNGSLLERQLPIETLSGKSVYIAVGKEGKVMVKGAKKLRSKLRHAGTLKQVEFEYFPGASHATMGHEPIMRAFEKI